MAAVERCPNHGMNVMAAPLTAESFLAADAVKLAVLSAFRTVDLHAKAGFHQMRQAGVIVWKLLHELLYRRDLRHGNFLHA